MNRREPLPQQMRALQLERHALDLEEALKALKLVSKPLPRPAPGQVLVRMEAAPCNPSDLVTLQGLYAVRKTLPAVPGWEGAGTVVQSGGGILGRLLVGRRVACGGQGDGDGTWAEYFVTEASMCVPLNARLTWEQGSMLIVNPLTAVGLFDKVTRGRHRAAIVTAGASQLGRMLARLAASRGLTIIHVVRREEQAALLGKLGAQVVLNGEREDFEASLQREAQRLKATIALDAVAGPAAGRLLKAMPAGSELVVYGMLSNEPCGGIDPHDLIFEGKRVTGFWLTPWLMNMGFLGRMHLVGKVQRLIADGVLDSTVHRRLRLDEVQEGLLEYSRRMSSGKALICPRME
ncbi:MAG: zinc-binding dehydrogenase [Syntrophobacteraceae bacterium]|nr:zinc-binding dehydrogenase [Syntrophobacteraceae bacterium]